jgi:hypothetical protein
MSNGFLSAVYPDPYRVIFTSDDRPVIWEYIKESGELHLLTQLPGEYSSRAAKPYSAVMGAHGVIYIAFHEYNGGTHNRILATVDGTSFYRLHSEFIAPDISSHPLYLGGDGRIYASGVSFRDITKEQYFSMVGETNSADMHGATRWVYHDGMLKDVVVTVTRKNSTNLLKDPSAESSTAGWSKSPSMTWNIVQHAAHGGAALELSHDYYSSSFATYTFQDTITSGDPIYIRVSATANKTLPNATIPRPYVELSTSAGLKTGLLGGATGVFSDTHRRDFVWVWTDIPAGTTLNSFKIGLITTTPDVHYQFSRISVSESPMYVSEPTPHSVSFMLGDHLVETEPLAAGESVTIKLPSSVWLEGAVPIVPVSGLAYTVEVDGDQATPSQQNIREATLMLEAMIPVIIGVVLIGAVITMVGRIRM